MDDPDQPVGPLRRWLTLGWWLARARWRAWR